MFDGAHTSGAIRMEYSEGTAVGFYGGLFGSRNCSVVLERSTQAARIAGECRQNVR